MTGKSGIVVMSSKGQVVVPREIRKAIDAEAGTEFIVYGSGNTIVFRKIRLPTFQVKELEKIVAKNEKKLKQAGYMDEESVKKLVEEIVAETRKRS